ncbi:MAG: LysR family transcriptional regulator [Firmicutes bacterium]|nr:LysR family transcriptional regulator [Bacillota bacterium]
MLKQIRYFQTVVRLGSFTAAAEEHFISQSAISQQIKALETELGVTLLKRKKRSFTLTQAGEYFYKKSLVLVADYDNILRELQKVSGNSGEYLRVGLLKGYSGKEFNSAVSEFTVKFPDVTVKVIHGNHDMLYALLRSGDIDIVLNDQRRAFSDEYINILLDIREYYVEISSNNPIAQLKEVEIGDLKNIPLILLSSPDQQETERSFYTNDLGFKSEIYFTEYIDDALMQIIQGKGYMPMEGSGETVQTTTKAVKLLRNGKPIIRRYCAFMKADNSSKHTNEFIEILKKQF